jgi:hypothetical protein
MTEVDPLFRQEALEYRARGDESTRGALRLGAPWLRWSYGLLLVLVAIGAALAWLVRTDESTTGPAVVDLGRARFSALLPAAGAPELGGARSVRLELSDGGRPLAVRVRRARPAEERAIRRAGLPQPEQPALLLSGRLPASAPGGRAERGSRLRGRMVVVVRSAPVGEVAIRQLRRMLGAGEAGT